LSSSDANPSRTGRVSRGLFGLSIVLNVVLGIAFGSVADPFGISKEPRTLYPSAPAAASPSPTRPAYLFAPSSDTPVNGALQCPDAGSVTAGKGDDRTQVVTVQDSTDKPIMLLGANRRVVIAKGATATGSVVMCGDGATLYIAGTMQGQVVIRGNSPKIVVQNGDKSKLPPAYSTSNGLVLSCTTDRANRSVPSCNDYLPRPGAKPNG
jgi:type IV secretory pathway TrbD component